MPPSGSCCWRPRPPPRRSARTSFSSSPTMSVSATWARMVAANCAACRRRSPTSSPATGMMLTQYLVEPSCTPSRAALMTGQYSIRNGLSLFIIPGTPNTLPGDAYTMGQLFKDAGYATALYGKWHLGIEPQSLPAAHGFDTFYGIPPNSSWSDATTVPGVVLTHSAGDIPEKDLIEKGPWIMSQEAGGELTKGEALHDGGARRDRRRSDRPLRGLHQGAGGGEKAVLPLSAVLDGPLAKPAVEGLRGQVAGRRLRRQDHGGRPPCRPSARRAEGSGCR